MTEYYLEKIEDCQKRIVFYEENPSFGTTRSMVTGNQRIEDAEWISAEQLIAIERRKISEFQVYAALNT